ncbi:hypothetical protein [Nostoc sp.]
MDYCRFEPLEKLRCSQGKDLDIDELENILGFDVITPGEFFSLADESKLKDDSQDWAWRNWLKSRTYTPDIIVNQSKFRFPQVPDKNVIIPGKSGLGSGKTEKNEINHR